MYKVLLKDKKQTNKQLGTTLLICWCWIPKNSGSCHEPPEGFIYVCMYWLTDWLILVTLTMAVTWPVYYLFFVEE